MTPTPDARLALPELLPCPFCGGDAEIDSGVLADRRVDTYVSCANDRCPAYLGGSKVQSRTDAIAAWNRRAARAPLPEDVVGPVMRVVIIEREHTGQAIRQWDNIGNLPAGEHFLYAQALAAANLAGGDCRWTVDDEWTWHGACGVTWAFTEDGPTENNYRYCHGCGKPIDAARQQQEKDA